MKRVTADRIFISIAGSMVAVGMAIVAIVLVGVFAQVFEPIKPFEPGYTIDATGCKQGQRHDLGGVKDPCSGLEVVR